MRFNDEGIDEIGIPDYRPSGPGCVVPAGTATRARRHAGLVRAMRMACRNLLAWYASNQVGRRVHLARRAIFRGGGPGWINRGWSERIASGSAC